MKASLLKKTATEDVQQLKGHLATVALSEIEVMEGFNARQGKARFSGIEFDELVASIRENGIIQPVLVRPIEGDASKYQLVAGERRIRAMMVVAGKADDAVVPVMVREMTDDEARELMLIENCQREDLTVLEEARGFDQYVKERGEEGVLRLAERIGKNPQFIRRRLAIVGLPEAALKMWEDGHISLGHLEKLMLMDEVFVAKWCAEAANEIARNWRVESVDRLAHTISCESPKLQTAKFKLEDAGCNVCRHNSENQASLFGDVSERGQCTSPECFAKHQGEHMTKHWKSSTQYKKYRTTGFRFRKDAPRDDYESFDYGQAGTKKCKACEHYLSVMMITGAESTGAACFGESACFGMETAILKKSKAGGDQPPVSAGQIQAEKKQERAAKRASNHGTEFREIHYTTAIPERIDALDIISDDVLRYAVIAMAAANTSMNHAIDGVLNPKLAAADDDELAEYRYRPSIRTEDLTKAVFDASIVTVREMFKAATKAVIMDERQVVSAGRHAVAMAIGVDLRAEWTLNEQYMGKKYTGELLDILTSVGIVSDPVFTDYVMKKHGAAVSSLKKKQLIEAVMKSGVSLAGRVPAEIENPV